MRIAPILLLTLGLILSLHADPALADLKKGPPTIDSLIQGRINILTKILNITEERYKAAEVDQDERDRARLDLYQFSRDSAKTSAKRIFWQDRIVLVEQERKTSVERKYAAGEATAVELMRAEERVMAAQQKRLELEPAK